MNWLSKIFGRPKTDGFDDFVKSISIDTSGPEFADLYPSREAVREAIVNTDRFKSSQIEWMSEIASAQLSKGTNYRGPLMAIVRAGELMTPAALKAVGISTRRKVGRNFVEAVSGDTVEEAIEALDLALHTATSKANQLHHLHRMKKIGIHFCKFLGPGEGANLPLEAELSGQRFSIDEAIDLVKSRACEIRRSVFTAEVNF